MSVSGEAQLAWFDELIGEAQVQEMFAHSMRPLAPCPLGPGRPAIEAMDQPGEHPITREIVAEGHGPEHATQRNVVTFRHAEQLDPGTFGDLLTNESSRQVERKRLVCLKDALAFGSRGAIVEAPRGIDRRQADRNGCRSCRPGAREGHEDGMPFISDFTAQTVSKSVTLEPAPIVARQLPSAFKQVPHLFLDIACAPIDRGEHGKKKLGLVLEVEG